jgi:hypothetical protein
MKKVVKNPNAVLLNATLQSLAKLRLAHEARTKLG